MVRDPLDYTGEHLPAAIYVTYDTFSLFVLVRAILVVVRNVGWAVRTNFSKYFVGRAMELRVCEARKK